MTIAPEVVRFEMALQPSDHRLWMGSASVKDRIYQDDSRTISVKLKGLPCEYNFRALRAEIEMVQTREVASALLISSCLKLSLEVRPGCDEAAEDVILRWFSALDRHLQDLPTGRIEALLSALPAPDPETAMATFGSGGFQARER